MLKIDRKRIGPALALLALFSIAIMGTATSNPHTQTEPTYQQQKNKDAAKYDDPSIFLKVAVWAEDHDVAIEAISSIMEVIIAVGLAAVTGLLWWSTRSLATSTNKLADGADAQVAEIAKATALAEKQFLMAGAQADLAVKQHALQRLRFLAEHRPKLMVRHVFLETAEHIGHPTIFFKHGSQIEGSLVVVNIGGSSATITDSSYRIYFSKTGLPTNSPLNEKGHELIDMGSVLQIGQSLRCDLDDRIVMEGTDPDALRQFERDGWAIYVMGQIRYSDEFGYERYMGFCRVWDGISKFRAVADPDYEYAD